MTAWTPKYALTPAIARGLMQIEAARALVDHTPLSPAAEAELRGRSRVLAAHFSTFIEGNRLTQEEASRVIADERAEVLAWRGTSPRLEATGMPYCAWKSGLGRTSRSPRSLSVGCMP